MDNVVIWQISIYDESLCVEIELFIGKNKYTKAGLFSGQLRRWDNKNFIADKVVNFMSSLKNITQCGKNKFKLHIKETLCLLDYFRQEKYETVYYRMLDRKLHHINDFNGINIKKNNKYFWFEEKTGILIYQIPNYCDLDVKQQSIVTIPQANLYLHSEKKKIRGYLVFSYQGIDLPANFSQENIQLSKQIIFRNLQYEQSVEEKLCFLGGHKSLKNEILFDEKNFFSIILPQMINWDINLYWGKDNKNISKSKISCSISYDMDWFYVSGEVEDENVTYTLSDLLKYSKGKSYVEINNSILFLPSSLQKIISNSNNNDKIKISKKYLHLINDIAEDFNIDPSTYLNKFLNFENATYTLDKKLDSILKPYQKLGISWIVTLYKNKFGGCLADDMGLGKTLQTIAFLCCKERNNNYPVLIVVPKVLLYNWENEFVRFTEKIKFEIAYGDFDYINIKDGIIYLTTYDTLISRSDEFSKVKFDCVVIDESQYAKNYKTKRYKSISNIKANFILALSGTPIENNVEELWSLMNLLNPGLLGSHDNFIKKFGNVHEDLGKAEILRKIISPFILRRTKLEVLNDLPSKTEEYLYCKMGSQQMELYKKILCATKNQIKEKPSRYTIKDNSIILQSLLYLREVCTEPQLLPPNMIGYTPCESCKFELFKDYCCRIMDQTGKIIVYSLFPKVLQKLQNWCNQQKWKTFYIDGSTNDRQKIVNEFENSEQGIFFISLKAGGVGLNLVSCQYVFIYDPWWNSAAEQQAANRVYRIGQDKPVFIYHFLVQDTIEEKIYELQRKKEMLSSNILEGMNIPEKISMDDIYKLLF